MGLIEGVRISRIPTRASGGPAAVSHQESNAGLQDKRKATIPVALRAAL